MYYDTLEGDAILSTYVQLNLHRKGRCKDSSPLLSDSPRHDYLHWDLTMPMAHVGRPAG